jgi:hypothetical protein
MKAAQLVVFSWKVCAYSHFVSSMHPDGAKLSLKIVIQPILSKT